MTRESYKIAIQQKNEISTSNKNVECFKWTSSLELISNHSLHKIWEEKGEFIKIHKHGNLTSVESLETNS